MSLSQWEDVTLLCFSSWCNGLCQIGIICRLVEKVGGTGNQFLSRVSYTLMRSKTLWKRYYLAKVFRTIVLFKLQRVIHRSQQNWFPNLLSGGFIPLWIQKANECLGAIHLNVAVLAQHVGTGSCAAWHYCFTKNHTQEVQGKQGASECINQVLKVDRKSVQAPHKRDLQHTLSKQTMAAKSSIFQSLC